jgi:hypothetical protein
MHWAFRISIFCSDILGPAVQGAIAPRLGAILPYPVDRWTCFFDFRRRDGQVWRSLVAEVTGSGGGPAGSLDVLTK